MQSLTATHAEFTFNRIRVEEQHAAKGLIMRSAIMLLIGIPIPLIILYNIFF